MANNIRNIFVSHIHEDDDETQGQRVGSYHSDLHFREPGSDPPGYVGFVTVCGAILFPQVPLSG